MLEVLKGYIGRFCFVYLDHILIFSSSPEEHEKHVMMVLESLNEYNLQIKSSKCEFFKTEITFLAHTISQGNIKPCDRLVNKITRAEAPKMLKQVVSFNVLISYYKKFVKKSTFCSM